MEPISKISRFAAIAAAGSMAASHLFAASVDIYESQFATQASSSPRPTMTAQPTVGIFSDVSAAAPAAVSSQAAMREDRSGSAAAAYSGRSSSGGGSTGGGGRYSGGGKSSKNVTLGEEAVVTPPAGPTFAITGGWDSAYWWHGEDYIASHTGAGDSSNTAGVWYGRIAMEWQGLMIYGGYLQTDAKVQPRDNVNSGRKYYREAQAGVSYTVGLIQNLDFTLGYNAYFIESTDWYGHDYQGEAFAKIAYHEIIPFITPSLSAFYLHQNSGSDDFHNGFTRLPGGIQAEGWMFEARIDGNVKLFSFGDGGSVSLNPYVTLLYDDGYWTAGQSSDFRNIDYGLNIPIAITKNLIVSLHGILHSTLIDRTGKIVQPDFVGGASITLRF